MPISMADPLKILSFAFPAFVAASTTPVVWRFAKNIRQAKPAKNDAIYEDKDGKATEESMASYSTKRQFIVIFVAVAVGLSASLAHIINAFLHILEVAQLDLILMLFGCWVCHWSP